ncbi:MAG: alpha/beta hydrolase [Spirochaetales bacterium]|nr:alpha/beta hydrolase [Spirochaetales bacterium]
MKRRIFQIEIALLLLLLASIPFIYFFQPHRAVQGIYRLYALRAGMSEGSAMADHGYTMSYYARHLERKEWPAIVLLHGISNAKIAFLQSSYYFPDKFRLLLPEFPGSGDSVQNPGRRYHIKAQAEALAALLSSLSLGRIHLVGNSMGGHIAATFALLYPERVQSLVLISPAGLTVTEKKPYRLLEKPLQSPADFDAYMKKAFVTVPWVPAPFKANFIKESQANFSWEQFLRREIRSGPYYILDNQIKNIKAPTLIVWGDQDRIISVKHAPVWKAQVPRSELLVLKDIGHGPQYEIPAETAGIISGFIQKNL